MCVCVCVCVCVYVADVNDEKTSRVATVPPKSRPMTLFQQTHARLPAGTHWKCNNFGNNI